MIYTVFTRVIHAFNTIFKKITGITRFIYVKSFPRIYHAL